jgi:KDO2-lipid IV(A) lauroyltransferase
MGARVGIFILWLLHFLPLPVLAPIGQGLGMLAYGAIRKRRRIARTNLSLCFPQMSARQREKLLRRHFRCFGRALLESGIAWWSSSQRLRRVVRMEGTEHVEALGDQRLIALVPHFVGIELEGIRMSLDYGGVAVYVRQKDPYVDAFLERKRTRFPGTQMISRREGVMAIVRAFRRGRALQVSPDMDLGARDSVFVPFFGVKAATVTALGGICKLTGARILPLVVRQLPGGRGYVVRAYPAWEDFPGASPEKDARRMNAFIEARILEMPEQYLWTHRRFKTRPPGEPSVY